MAGKVISADSHVIEPHDLWQQRLDPAFVDRAPRLVHEAATDRLVFDDAELPPVGLLAGCARGDDDVRLDGRWDDDVFPGGYDPQIRLADLEKDGISGEVLFPTIGMQLYRVRDADFRWALFRAYNTWIAEFAAAGNGVFKGVGMLSEDDPALAAAEVRRCAGLGLSGVMLPQVPGEDVSYAHERFDVVWAAAQTAGMPVNFHAATTRDEKQAWNKVTLTDGVIALPYQIERVIMDMILYGVFDRFPGLRIVSVENDAGWAAQMVERGDFYWRRQTKLKRHLGVLCERPPSEYFRTNVRATFMRDRTAILTREIIGDGTAMWGNDFPHHVSTWPNSRQELADIFRDQPDDARERMVYANAAELYGFDI